MSATDSPTTPDAPHPVLGNMVRKNLAKHGGIFDLNDYHQNDSGRAELFVDVNQLKVRFVPDWNCWLIWDGNRWIRDAANQITFLAIEHHRNVQAHVLSAYDNPKTRAQVLQDTLRTGDARPIKDMIALASADPRIVGSSKKLDANPNLLGLPNGVWDFKTGALRKGQPEDLITRQVACAYDPAAEAPRWREFLKWATAGDAGLEKFLQRVAGYTFTGHTNEEVWFFHYGKGGNGKSVFCDTLMALAQEGEYSKKVQHTLYTNDANGKIPEDQLASLQGVRLALGPEVDAGERMSESRIKEITTNNATINGRWQHARQITFTSHAKLWIYGNYCPEIRGTDDGIWRRLRLIPWQCQVSKEQRDRELSQKLLRDEAPGILRWVLDGAQEWIKTKSLGEPKCVLVASEEYREEEDVLADYIEAELTKGPDLWTPRTPLYTNHYVEWAKRNQMKPWSARVFYRRIRQIPGVRLASRNNVRGFLGIIPTS